MRRQSLALAVSVAAFGVLASGGQVEAGSTSPYYRRRPPLPLKADGSRVQEADFQRSADAIDLSQVRVAPYPAVPGDLATYNRLFDARAAARSSPRSPASGSGATPIPHSFGPPNDLVEFKRGIFGAPNHNVLGAKALAAMAYSEYFPQNSRPELGEMLEEAISLASPGWCGTFGPGIDGTSDVLGRKSEGNYDMNQMHLLPLAYRLLRPAPAGVARALITLLLARGDPPPFRTTSRLSPAARPPNDWSRAATSARSDAQGHRRDREPHPHDAGHPLPHEPAALPENARPEHDNRRNGGDGRPSCFDLVLSLLRNILRGDFSEYNAKHYQEETRRALLNLCSYAYDHEVRLAARMVLDYVAARYAVTSNDLRRMVPFRRRNEGENVSLLGHWSDDACPRGEVTPSPYEGVMDVGLLDWQLGSDPLVRFFALQAGNTRAFERPNLKRKPPFADEGCNNDVVRPGPWAVADGGHELVIEALSDYRLPPSIHDLFVNDAHRRFFQRLQRFYFPEEAGGDRNCNHYEINASSPSYLITAGSKPCGYAIFPGLSQFFKPSTQFQQIGVAVPTSFIPTGSAAGVATPNARDVVQLSSFSDEAKGTYRPNEDLPWPPVAITRNAVANYCVAPDFACGHRLYLPAWVEQPERSGRGLPVRESAGARRGRPADGAARLLSRLLRAERVRRSGSARHLAAPRG